MSDAKQKDKRLDQTVEDSFPASDPPSHTPATGTRKAEQAPPGGHQETEAKGMPTSDRHAAETVAGRIEGSQPAEKHDP